jgi:hypothetical protein
MSKDSNIQFTKLIYEVFSSTLQDYDLNVIEEHKNLVIAKKGDVDLIFRLEAAPLFYYFGLEIKLSGELGEKATSDVSLRHLSVDVIANCLDANYKPYPKAAQTEEDLRARLERDKKELLEKYCKSILLGDVSFWPRVVSCLREKSGIREP